MSTFTDYCEAYDALSPDNQQRLPVVEWLVSQSEKDRRTGRSGVLAMAFVRACLESGRPVTIFDHHGTDGARTMANRVMSMFPESANVMGDNKLRVEPSPALPVRGSVEYTEGTRVILGDFLASARTLLRAGHNVHDLVSLVRGCLVREVIET